MSNYFSKINLQKEKEKIIEKQIRAPPKNLVYIDISDLFINYL